MGADFSGASFIRADMYNVNFVHADLTNCDLRRARITVSDFRHVNWDNADLGNALILKTKLYNTAKFTFKSIADLRVIDSFYDHSGTEDIHTGLEVWIEHMLAQ